MSFKPFESFKNIDVKEIYDSLSNVFPEARRGLKTVFESPDDAVNEAIAFAQGPLAGTPDATVGAQILRQTVKAKDSGTTIYDDIKNAAKRALAEPLASTASYLERKQSIMLSIVDDINAMIAIVAQGKFGPNLREAATHVGNAVFTLDSILSRLSVVTVPVSGFGTVNTGFDHGRYSYAKNEVDNAIEDLKYDLTQLYDLWMGIKAKLKRLMSIDAHIEANAAVTADLINIPLIMFIREQLDASRTRLVLNATLALLVRFVVAETERQKLTQIRSLMDAAVIESSDAETAYNNQITTQGYDSLYIRLDALSENMVALGTMPSDTAQIVSDTQTAARDLHPEQYASAAEAIYTVADDGISEPTSTVNLTNVQTAETVMMRNINNTAYMF